MIWQLKQTSNFGASSPAVARTVIQGHEILNLLSVRSEQKKDALIVLKGLSDKLIRCVAVEREVASAIEQVQKDLADEKLTPEKNASAFRQPSIPDLEGKAESFLQGAKLAIAQATRLIEPFYGVTFGHQLNKLGDWATKRFGADHAIARMSRDWEPWVKEILTMRDAVDHPKKGPRQSLHVRNFYLESDPEGLTLVAPQWWLEGEPMHSMAAGMAAIVEGIIELQECLLVCIFEEHKGNFPVGLIEIPAAERDPKCPVRLRPGLTIKLENGACV